MTRQKKSRKTGPLAQSQKPRDSKGAVAEGHGKKKGKGQKAGQRHSQPKNQRSVGSQQQTVDPRKGSRRKVTLVAASKPEVVEQLSPAQELAQLEQDTKLQSLVERFEQGEVLTDDEQRYLDEKSDRYEQLAEQLGMDLEDDDDWDDEEY